MVRGRSRRGRAGRLLGSLGLALTLVGLPGPALAAAPAPAPEAVPAGAPAAPAGCQGQQSFSDPPPEFPWPLVRLAPERVWPMTRGSGVTVAVIDSGVSNNHPQLRDAVIPGYDTLQPPGTGTVDCSGHGTIIAGTIAARDKRGTAFYGLAPDARILPIRVLLTTERTTDPNAPVRIANAIRYAADRGAQVINLSLNTEPIPQLRAAVQYARAKGAVIVAAAGNKDSEKGEDTIKYPAAYPEVIAVAGVDQNGDHVKSSVRGPFVDVAGPGDGIWGPAPLGDGYVQITEKGVGSEGTSFATGYVSATAALVKAYRPELTPDQVADRILRTADHPPGGRNDEVGYGMVNPYLAVTAILDDPPRHTTAPAALPPAEIPEDPLAGTRTAAVAIALGVLVALVLGGVTAVVLPHGRRRDWRPGRSPMTSSDPS